MTADVCLTVDVEDWYDGMEVLGERIPRPNGAASGLTDLATLLESVDATAQLTLFVVGNYAERIRTELADLAAAGHEIASHGPDHGRLPDDPAALVEWLRRGRAELEDLVQRPVLGFRSPRFDIPPAIGLHGFRELLAEAGFAYVSDTSRLGGASPVQELPVLRTSHYPIGGGSYQRLLPRSVTDRVVGRASGTAVLYYHSYDFGATLPGIASIRSLAVAKQLLGRDRVSGTFSRILSRYGSKACGHVGR
jgi:hypothetical protein